uniref:Uncharacterized protein n=1 Tax=Arundo donax TaxID=35708 RepID=A0A0A9F8Y6_ARUDO
MITTGLELDFICFISISSISFFTAFFLWLTKRIFGVTGRPSEAAYAANLSAENLLRSNTSLSFWR